MVLLTKSKYLMGLQCPKYLWTVFNSPDKIPPNDDITLYRFDEGTKVGEFAKELFPEGVDLAGLGFGENIEKTESALKDKKPIFEAGLIFGECFSRIDILVPVKDEWDIIEVKSATRVKDVNIEDVSFQKYCAQGKGLKIRKCYLMHINNKYVRKGEVEPKKLFARTDITEEVDKAMEGIKERVEDMFKIIKSKDCPSLDIGEHCGSPYDCPLEECWDFLPEYNVSHLCHYKKKSFELIEMGIYSIKDIPEDIKLNGKQQIQRQCEMTGKPYIDKEAIGRFLKTLEYPLYFLDFETFNSAIPLFDGLKPYQQIPFQFSLHVVAEEGGKAEHHSFLSSSSKDPRKEFVSELKKVLGSRGSVVVYNQSFEIRILEGLAEMFPENKRWVSEVVGRVVDLLVPFRNFSYYHYGQKGSASLKNVLPVVTGKSYKHLDIADGFTASLAFIKMSFEEVSEEEVKRVRENLEKYCCLDTLGMAWIVEELLGV